MKQKNSLFAKVWEQSYNRFGKEWENDLSKKIELLFGPEDNERWAQAVEGYVAFSFDAIKAQSYFEQHGVYPASSYADCLELCYRNPDYMKRRYLPGQYLSHYIWPHHYTMLSHYRQQVLPQLKAAKQFYEVGVGCGMYSATTLTEIPEISGIGVDISDYSLGFTQSVVEAHGFGDRYKIMNHNIYDGAPAGKADLVICQEVLEHIESPQDFIAALGDMVRPGGEAYISAAINAAHTDHIYLYRSPAEVRAQLEAAGWRVKSEHIEQVQSGKDEGRRPTIAAYFCTR